MASTQVVVRPEKKLVRRSLPVQRDLSIDYLRATIVILVLANHSALAYITSAHFGWRNMILSDQMRWAVFDYLENFTHVFSMPLMFFISGLFVYPALQKRGAVGFLRDRFLRLGIPFVFSVAVLLPVAFYAPWRLTGRHAGFLTFYLLWPRRNSALGPPWFLWQLLFFDLVLVVCLRSFSKSMMRVERLIPRLRNRPFAAFIAIVFLSTLVYVPLLRLYGGATWTDLITWPFTFQTSQIGLYALWFLFGLLVGARGLVDGLISHHASLARHWPLWILGCVFSFSLLAFLPRWFIAHAPTIPHVWYLQALLWVATCVAGCFGFLALFRGIPMPSLSWMKSLSRSAYVIYLVHYVFIAWSQSIVLNRPIHPGVKFLFVFLTTILLSWLTAQLLLRIPTLRSVL